MSQTRFVEPSINTKIAMLKARIAFFRAKNKLAYVERMEAELAAIEAEAKAGEEA